MNGLGNLHTYALPDDELAPVPTQNITVEVVNDDGTPSPYTSNTGALHIPDGDGGIIIDFEPKPAQQDAASKFDANLAEEIPESVLSEMAENLLRGIEEDNESRAEWLETRQRGLDLLGLKIEQPRTEATSEGMSTVRSQLLLEAVLRFQANARGELLPARGPAKISIVGGDGPVQDQIAANLEEDFNYYLTKTASEYYPDTDRMFFMVGFGGCGFKKVYHHPLKRRPISESIDAEDLIISNAATDMRSCTRLTHRVRMREATMKRMMMVGAYRRVDLVPMGQPDESEVDRAKSAISGQRPATSATATDRDRDLYECYCEYDIPGFEHKGDDGDPSGLPIPYKVTIDRDSRVILEVRRNYLEDDPMCMPRSVFVKYPYVPGIGFYDIGLVNILGNSANALTAATRMLLDAGMFSNFPGFLYLQDAGRQDDMTFRIPPGSGRPIRSDGTGDIKNMIMPLPYKGPDQALMSLATAITGEAQRVGGTAELQVGDGRQDAPVGTTLALIEQATKIQDAVHKRLHSAQAEEFGLLLDLIREDPEALWRHNPRSKILAALGGPNGQAADLAQDQNKMARIVAELSNYSLVPQADPNTASQTSRIMKVSALVQMVAQNPQLYDVRKVSETALQTIGFSNPDEFFNQQPQGAPPPSIKDQAAATTAQAALIKAQADAANVQQDAQASAVENQQRALDRESKERIEAEKLATTVAVHPDAKPLVDQTLGQVGYNLFNGMPN